MLKTILLISQITIPLLLIAAILLQQKGTALGGAFGGGDGGSFYSKKRGLEKKLGIATIVLSGLFLISSLLNILVR